MVRANECNCNRGIGDFRYVKFEITGSRIEQKYICDDLIGWWYNSNTKKIMPSKRPRSEEECLAMNVNNLAELILLAFPVYHASDFPLVSE